MPRDINYYNSRPAQSAPATPAAPVAPTPETPAPEAPVQNNIPATRKQAYEQNGFSNQAAYDDYIKKEGERSWISRLPYEAYKLTYDMPDERTWQGMNLWEKYVHLNKEGIKSTYRTLKALPAVLIKAPIAVGYQPISMFANGLSELTTGKKVLPEKFNIPVLGEVRTMNAAADEAKAMGVGPAMQGVYSFSEMAGNIGASAALVDAVQAAFRPRVATVQGAVERPDIRPLTAEQVQNVSKAKASQGKIITSEPITFGEAKQNPNVQYFKIPQQAAEKYSGNTNNTFLKISPMGEGQAEYSIVQLRKSLVDQGKDWLASKFGRSSVVEGKFGPELKIDSGVFPSQSTALTVSPGGAAAVPAATESAITDFGAMMRGLKTKAMTSAVDSKTKLIYNESKGSGSAIGAAPYRGVNVDNLADMESHFQSPDFKDFGKSINDTAKKYGVKIISESDASGAWKDTDLNKVVFEPSKRIVVENNMDVDKYAADIGMQKNQQSIYRANFETPNPKGVEYEIGFKSINDAFEFSKTIEESGIEGISLDKNTNSVFIGDPDQSLFNKVNNFYERAKQQGIVTKFGGKRADIRFIGQDEYGSILGLQAGAGEGSGSAIQAGGGINQPPELPSIMAKPIRGFENKVVTGKQVGQVLELAKNKEIDPNTVRLISQTITGKGNINELTQAEAYNVSETIRGIAQNENNLYDFNPTLNRALTHPARYWMEAAERESKIPVYSDIYLPMETGTRLARADFESWQEKFREMFGQYADTKYVEERRMITAYLEGDKGAITANETLTPEVKTDLTNIAEQLKEYYKDAFESGKAGISSTRFFENYSARIRKSDGIRNLYKDKTMPPELKTFFEFEREGMMDVLEDDALALADIYAKALARKRFVSPAYDNAQKVLAKMPDNLKAVTEDYLGEKMGYKDGWEKAIYNWGETLSKKFDFGPNLVGRAIDYMMTTSYAGALGLPRIAPIFMNTLQLMLTTYPEFGTQFTAKGIQDVMEKGINPVKEKGFLIDLGMPYGSDVAEMGAKGFVGKSLDKYLQFNKAMLKPYGSVDSFTRAATYYSTVDRFNHFWQKFKEGKISYDQMEEGINMDGFNPTLQNVIRGKLAENTGTAVNDAVDLMAQDILDRTQFPYRKGAESRIHYGLKGKLGFQFLQWPWEYGFTLKSWVARKQWDKLLKWYGISYAIGKAVEDRFDVDISKYLQFGPVLGSVVGPVAKMGMSAIGMVNSATAGLDDDVNRYWADIAKTAKIYGGTLTGVGASKVKQMYHSIDMYFKMKNSDFNFDAFAQKLIERGARVNLDEQMKSYRIPLDQRIFQRMPVELKLKWISAVYPEGMPNAGQFGVYSSTGKLLRYVTFSELLKETFGFKTTGTEKFNERISNMNRDITEYGNAKVEAMKEFFK